MSQHKPCDFPHIVNRPMPQAGISDESNLPEGWSAQDVKDFGAKEFEPWDLNATTLPSNAEWQNAALVVRLAFAINCKTKAQLIDIVRMPDEDGTCKDLTENFLNIERMMDAMRSIVECAFARLCAAGCAADVEDA